MICPDIEVCQLTCIYRGEHEEIHTDEHDCDKKCQRHEGSNCTYGYCVSVEDCEDCSTKLCSKCPEGVPIEPEAELLTEIAKLCRQQEAKVRKEIIDYLESQCLNKKHKNYKYAKTDCHECIDELIASLKKGKK